MKYLGLALLLCLAGCERHHDPKVVTWIKQSTDIDLRTCGGMPYMANGISNGISYAGKSPYKAAQSILDHNPDIIRIGPIVDVTEYAFQPGFCFRAKKGIIEGYILFQGPYKDQKSEKLFWGGYRFYSEDFFLKMEQEYKKKKEPNQSPQTTIMAVTPAASHPSRQP